MQTPSIRLVRNKQKLSINQRSRVDRPREKMMARDAEALDNAELLGILIDSGNMGENAVELMRRVFASCDNNLNELGKWEIWDFSSFKGMGLARSLTIMTALELGRGRKLRESKECERVRCSENVCRPFHPLICDLLQEELWTLLLNQICKVINRLRISTGGIDETYTDVCVVLREALIRRATQIVLIHNHPLGSAKPSQEDKRLTTAIQKASQTTDVILMDYIIVCDGYFYGFADKGFI